MSGSHQGYVPQGLQHAEEHSWKARNAPMPDYALRGEEDAKFPVLSRAYILAGAIGVVVIGFFILLFLRLFARKVDEDVPPRMDARPSQT